MQVLLIPPLFILTCSIAFSDDEYKNVDDKSMTDPLRHGIEAFKYALSPGNNVIDPEDYDDIAKHLVSGNNAFFKDTDVTLNISQLIRKNGFNAEEYHVETEDGYILGLFRIPGSGPTIFLMHGILQSADDWVTAGRETGLAYLLAEKGFDIWMGNVRGNKHSRRHKTLSPDTAEFWNFTYYEIGIYDVTAMIDFALEVTNQSQLIYIGFSQGTTVFFVMCSEKLEYNSKISLMVALAPVAAVPHIKSPLFLFLRTLTFNRGNLPFRALRLIGYNEFLPASPLIRFLTLTVCGNSFLQTICNDILYIATGLDFSQLNYTTLPTVYSHLPAGSSTKTLEHYGQSVANGKFRKYDFGTYGNIEEYGSKRPPKFPVENITTPIALFYGRNDELAAIEDVFILRRNLRSVIKSYEVPYSKFQHLDFNYAKDFKRLVFPSILEVINTRGIQNGRKVGSE